MHFLKIIFNVFQIWQVLYETGGIPVQTSFFILAGSTLCLTVNTFFLLPKRKSIPWPLPADYRIGSGESPDSHAPEPLHVYTNPITDTEDGRNRNDANSKERTSGNTEMKLTDENGTR